jgi:hypothetical protein
MSVSVYRRAGRPTWYVAFDGAHGRVCRSTGFRIDDPDGERKARRWGEERDVHVPAATAGDSHAWDRWVISWLRDQYAEPEQAKTLRSYLGAWSFLRLYLRERRIQGPEQLTYSDVTGYIPWRTKRTKRSGKKVTKNTALHNIRILSVIMREAVRRNWCQGNPCDRLGVKKAAITKPRPEITDDEIARIREGLRTRPEWMRVAFEIALHQGCRLRETQVPLRDVDLDRRTITFRAKGGDTYTSALHPALVPLLRDLKARGATVACRIEHHSSRNFTRFLQSIGLGHLCFHCTRVTCITRMARAGVPVQQAMRYVHHATESIHAIYQRLRADDLQNCVAALAYPEPPPSPVPVPSAPGRRRSSGERAGRRTPGDRAASAGSTGRRRGGRGKGSRADPPSPPS